MDIQLYLVNAGDDEFSTLAVLRQHLDLSFAEARDHVMDIPSTLPLVSSDSVDALQEALAAVGAEISTTLPEAAAAVVEESAPSTQLSVDDLHDFFSAPVGETPAADNDSDEYDSDEEDESDEEFDDDDSVDVIFTLASCGRNKLQVVKAVCEYLKCGLKEAKEICDDAPIDVTLDGDMDNAVSELVNLINEVGGEAYWDYADGQYDDEDDDDEEDVDDEEEVDVDEIEDPDGESNLALVLANPGPSKLQVVKIIKEFLATGLLEAKNYVDGAPVVIPLTNAQAANLRSVLDELEAAGANAYGTAV